MVDLQHLRELAQQANATVAMIAETTAREGGLRCWIDNDAVAFRRAITTDRILALLDVCEAAAAMDDALEDSGSGYCYIGPGPAERMHDALARLRGAK